jgi:DNA replication protein DnaC
MVSEIDQRKLGHLLACGVPELEAEVVARGPEATTTALAVREFSKSDKTFCLILGGAGSGKTIAAAEALLNAKLAWNGGQDWAYSSSEAKFALASHLARLSYFDAESQKRLARIERYRWLVLDDVGGELVTDTWKSNFTELILQRNSARLKTIITSNLSAEDFKTRYDERIISRIRGNGVVISSGKTDLRRAPLVPVMDDDVGLPDPPTDWARAAISDWEKRNQ